jgi:hypothetical protein
MATKPNESTPRAMGRAMHLAYQTEICGVTGLDFNFVCQTCRVIDSLGTSVSRQIAKDSRVLPIGSFVALTLVYPTIETICGYSLTQNSEQRF